MTGQEGKQYVEFMMDPANHRKCSGCPENCGADSGSGWRLPCGQYHCWVDCHTGK